MIQNNINAKSKSRGFTIVELLVVIVVIGILASITIVSYTGITAKANAAATKQMASNVISKVGIYQTEGSTLNWPVTGALAMSATSSSPAITGITVSGTTTVTASMTTISYQICGTTNSTSAVTAPASLAALIGASGVLTGSIVGYWDYGNATPQTAWLTAGQTSGSGYTAPNGTYYANLVACFPALT